MDIASGRPEDHPTPLPLDASGLPGVQAPTVIVANEMTQGGVFDSTAAFAQQAREGAAAAAAAMSAGMAAAGDRRGRYEAAMSPLGASYGDAMMLPVVPEDATAPASDFLFAQGDQPGRGT